MRSPFRRPNLFHVSLTATIVPDASRMTVLAGSDFSPSNFVAAALMVDRRGTSCDTFEPPSSRRSEKLIGTARIVALGYCFFLITRDMIIGAIEADQREGGRMDAIDARIEATSPDLDDLERFVVEENISRFHKLLDVTTDETESRAIRQQLAEQVARLRKNSM